RLPAGRRVGHRVRGPHGADVGAAGGRGPRAHPRHASPRRAVRGGMTAGMRGLPAAPPRERTADTLRHVGLYEERYRPIGGYSTGMRQRVKLAQSLVHDPRLLLLDAPTHGPDPARRHD